LRLVQQKAGAGVAPPFNSGSPGAGFAIRGGFAAAGEDAEGHADAGLGRFSARFNATAERGCNNTVTTAIDGLDGFAKLDFRARVTP
jgi:hypothetical protein